MIPFHEAEKEMEERTKPSKDRGRMGRHWTWDEQKGVGGEGPKVLVALLFLLQLQDQIRSAPGRIGKMAARK